jgi:hypothetical protein
MRLLLGVCSLQMMPVLTDIFQYRDTLYQCVTYIGDNDRFPLASVLRRACRREGFSRPGRRIINFAMPAQHDDPTTLNPDAGRPLTRNNRDVGLTHAGKESRTFQ